MNTAPETAAAPNAWNFKQLLAAWGIAFILQSLFLPCLCDIGTAKILFAYTLDALILFRVGMAFVRRETGGGWKIYAWLLCTSPLWIQGIAYLIFAAAPSASVASRAPGRWAWIVAAIAPGA